MDHPTPWRVEAATSGHAVVLDRDGAPIAYLAPGAVFDEAVFDPGVARRIVAAVNATEGPGPSLGAITRAILDGDAPISGVAGNVD